MTERDFVHLHVHTEYSLLDGLSRIDRLVDHARTLGMDTLAITDHGTMFGVIEFFRACRGAGIKPIIGVEAYLARRGMTDRDPREDRKPYHLLLLAKNMTGYRNLLKIASAAQLEGYYYNPRIDRDFLAAHAEGLIATSGCLAAQIPNAVMAGRDEDARDLIGWYQDVFGRENFFLELQQHDINELRQVNGWLIENRAWANVPLVATNDVHYVLAEDYDPHDTLLCIQTSTLKSDTNRLRMSDASYHLKSQAEMWRDFGDIMDGAPLKNTRLIADMCDVDLDTKGYHLPIFPVPSGFTAGSYLRYLCEKGLTWRFGPDAHSSPTLTSRLYRELDIIHDMGFDTYFLIVWDLCEYARHADIWWNVRGSGAGSLAAYCLGITNIDPIQNNLLFERFLNPGRVSMPDIDLDYPDDRRAEMIDYTARKYGEDKVAAIITFGTLGAKAAVRDVGRVLNVPLPDVNQAAGLIPTEPKPKPLMKYVEDNPDLKRLYNENTQIRQVIDTARTLQGVSRHASTHAAGVIVADKPLVEYIPLHRLTRGDDENSSIRAVTQFPMETCESIGLLKIDFLGLSTLTILRKACDLIERHQGIRYTMDNIPYRHEQVADDPEQLERLNAAFEMLGRGETVGVFQMESGGMQQMLRGMRPKKFENIIAGISLYRPGPMDYIPTYNARLHGTEPVHFHHDKLEPILAETYGIIVYQEQIMQIAGQLFGYELGEADLMRRAVSKKKEKDLLTHKSIFMERGPENGIDAGTAERIFGDIEFFANYGFNKCVTADTEIVDADTGRRVRVGDLASGAAEVESALTLETDTLHLKSGRITAVMENGVKPVYRLVTQLGHSITTTANHPFLTFNGWRMLGELAPGDRVAVVAPTVALAWRGDPLGRLYNDSSMAFVPDVALQEKATATIHPDSDIYWDRVVSIEYAGEQPTYDLTIDETHNFVANSIIVHNSHAADYAVITVQTAYLKAHYPEEYMTALLTVHRSDSAKIAVFLEECRRLDIPILPPDVNHSQLDFDIQPVNGGRRGIRFGLAAVKNVGVGPLQAILDARAEGGPFASIVDLCRRVDLRTVGKRALESLIRVGALTDFGPRSALGLALDRMMNFSASYHKDREVGQMNMFGMGDSAMLQDALQIPDVPEASHRDLLSWEKELLGLYVTGRPADKLRAALRAANTADIRELKVSDYGHDRPVVVAGEIVTVRRLYTRSNEPMGVIHLEDWRDTAGTVDVVVFPRTWAKCQHLVQDGEIVKVAGKWDTSRGEPQIIADSITQNFEVVMAAEGSYTPPVENGLPPWLDDEPGLWADDDEGPPPLPPDYFDEETGESPQPQPEVTPEPEPYVAPATQGAAAVPLPSVEPQLVSAPAGPQDNGDPSQAHHWIYVYLRRSGEDERDRRRFRRVYNLLTSYHGDDRFSIVIEGSGEPVKIEFPNHTTGLCDNLYDDLVKATGNPDDVRVFSRDEG